MHEWKKWLDWAVAAFAAYGAIVALALIVGAAFSLPILSGFALQFAPFTQALSILGNVPILTGIVALVINGLVAMMFYKSAGKDLGSSEDIMKFVVKFVVFLTFLVSIGTMNFLGILLSGYMVARIWKYV